MSITFVARTMETRAPSIVLKMHKCLKARDMSLLAGVHVMQRELYVSLGEVNFYPPSIPVPSTMIL